jgi:predicted GH43/DUF377 family glycosyl hydrolase
MGCRTPQVVEVCAVYIMKRKKIRFERELSSYKGRALGTYYHNEKILLFHQSDKANKFEIDRSVNGFDFNAFIDSAKILDKKGKEVDIDKCSDFRITGLKDSLFLTYKYSGSQPALYAAKSKDLISWKTLGKVSTPAEVGMLVPKIKFNDEDLLFFGEKVPLLASSKNLKDWKILGGPYHNLTKNKKQTLKVADIVTTNEGVLVIYFIADKSLKKNYMIKAALFDKNQPTKLIWDKLIWKQTKKWKADSAPVGAEIAGNILFTYWQSKKGIIFVLSFPYFKSILKDAQPVYVSPIVKKFKNNPILKPIIHHFWESKAVFNPTAFYDEGDIHIIYRAVGDDDVSTLGYAKSKDGFNINKRYSHPIFVPTQSFEGSQFLARNHRSRVKRYKAMKTSPYASGPGIGGCEDPRVTKLSDRLYMTYVAFNGYEQGRSALTSISLDDFQNEKWNWSTPMLIQTKPTVWGTGGKNACLLSEKLDNKFVIMHRFWPNIVVDYYNDLDFGKGKKYLRTGLPQNLPDDMWEGGRFDLSGAVPLESENGWLAFYGTRNTKRVNNFDMGVRLLDKVNTKKVLADFPNIEINKGKEFLEDEGVITPRANSWDSAKIGVGAPPILTDDGWLLIYQAVGYQDSSKYKVGAMLLDRDNPAKEICRSITPIIEPDMHYENEGLKAGVVYPCGAVIKDEELIVYYGGADTVGCIAHANAQEFLGHLKLHEKATLKDIHESSDKTLH